MHAHWAHAGTSIVAAFLASTVEFVEALTVVLAIGTVRGWRGALIGSGAGITTLLVIVLLAGRALTRVPLGPLQLALGTLLLLFGMRWLRKAVLRSAGVIPLHDENAAYAMHSESLRHSGIRGAQGAHRAWDAVAIGAAFKITMLEGTEVVFIVIAVGTGGSGLLLPASVGALAALVLVVLLGLIVHRPLASVPENALKFIVGILLCSFGTFWVGEGIGLTWPGRDWSILGLVAGFLLAAGLGSGWCRMLAAGPAS